MTILIIIWDIIFFTSVNSSSSSSGFSTLDLNSKKSVSLLCPWSYDLLSEFIRKWQIDKLFTMYVPNISFIDTKLNTTKLIWNRCNTRPWEDLLFYIFGYYCIHPPFSCGKMVLQHWNILYLLLSTHLAKCIKDNTNVQNLVILYDPL